LKALKARSTGPLGVYDPKEEEKPPPRLGAIQKVSEQPLKLAAENA